VIVRERELVEVGAARARLGLEFAPLSLSVPLANCGRWTGVYLPELVVEKEKRIRQKGERPRRIQFAALASSWPALQEVQSAVRNKQN